MFADEVLVIDSKGNERLRTGTILDFRGDTLTLETANGNKSNIASDRIKSLATEWSKPHQEAEKYFAEGKFSEALEAYREAYQREERGWVRRRLRARVVWCFHNLGRDGDACRNFGRLIENDPESPYFDAIPLQWPMQRCPADVKKVVASWMNPPGASQSDAVKQLIAASWLLVEDRKRAVTTLKDLAAHPSQNIRSLAKAQLWRAELLRLEEHRMTWWLEQLDSTPVELRGGSHYLMGKSLTRFKKYDEAVLAFLRVPTMYSDDRPLSQLCLVEAAGILQRQAQDRESRTLYQQAIKLGANSIWGQQAKAALESRL